MLLVCVRDGQVLCGILCLCKDVFVVFLLLLCGINVLTVMVDQNRQGRGKCFIYLFIYFCLQNAASLVHI